LGGVLDQHCSLLKVYRAALKALSTPNKAIISHSVPTLPILHDVDTTVIKTVGQVVWNGLVNVAHYTGAYKKLNVMPAGFLSRPIVFTLRHFVTARSALYGDTSNIPTSIRTDMQRRIIPHHVIGCRGESVSSLPVNFYCRLRNL
jgi:hypothetical protein